MIKIARIILFLLEIVEHVERKKKRNRPEKQLLVFSGKKKKITL